jgi:hypothetical protein
VTGLLGLVLPVRVPSASDVAKWCSLNSAALNCNTVQELKQSAVGFAAMDNSRETVQQQREDCAHDSYFRIQRRENDETAVFVSMILQARLILFTELEEAQTTIGDAALRRIDQSFADLLACMHGGRVNEKPSILLKKAPAAPCDPMQRWVRGHQIFAALTQGLIFSFQSLGRALRSGRHEEVARWADLSSGLLHASGATFRLTGDFPPELYGSLIRPSMMPPAFPVSLSGLMSSDHRFFVKLTGRMKPALKSLYELDPLRHSQVSEGMTLVYDSHIYVCERFVGNRPSIYTAGRTEKSGPELVEHFKALRLKSFERASSAPRVCEAPSAAPAPSCPLEKAPSEKAPLEKSERESRHVIAFIAS